MLLQNITNNHFIIILILQLITIALAGTIILYLGYLAYIDFCYLKIKNKKQLWLFLLCSLYTLFNSSLTFINDNQVSFKYLINNIILIIIPLMFLYFLKLNIGGADIKIIICISLILKTSILIHSIFSALLSFILFFIIKTLILSLLHKTSIRKNSSILPLLPFLVPFFTYYIIKDILLKLIQSIFII